MSSNAFFSDLLTSISERGRTLLRRAGSSEPKRDGAELISLCEALVSGRGEASGTAIAREILDRYRHLNEAQRLAFFEALTRDFGPDREKLARAIESWRAQRSDEEASDLHFASEPRRQELVRRLNLSPTTTLPPPPAPRPRLPSSLRTDLRQPARLLQLLRSANAQDRF